MSFKVGQVVVIKPNWGSAFVAGDIAVIWSLALGEFNKDHLAYVADVDPDEVCTGLIPASKDILTKEEFEVIGEL